MREVKAIHELGLEPGFDLHWQMEHWERFALMGLLKEFRPKLSLEIGTYKGGSLQVLARLSERVISIDIDAGVAKALAGRFENVEYFSGDSRVMLPEVIRTINADGSDLNFVLIDGDHSAEGIKRDIENVLKLVPRTKVIIIMHDSFNPDCRAGMKLANWNLCPYVHHVELDFIPGVYHFEAYDTAQARTMWGGFACAVIEPISRGGALEISESQKGLYEAVLAVSTHANRKHRGLLRKGFGLLRRGSSAWGRCWRGKSAWMPLHTIASAAKSVVSRPASRD